MRSVLRTAMAAWARRRIERVVDLQIADDTRVNYRGIHARSPRRLTIGSGSIFEGRIVADRPEAEIAIGERTFVGNSSLVCAERIEIGDDVLISWGCTIIDHHSHAVAWPKRKDDVRNYFEGRKSWADVQIKPVRIENKSWIGFNSIVLPGVTIGEGSVVGCGSVVTRDVPPFSVVAGNPARLIREILHDG